MIVLKDELSKLRFVVGPYSKQVFDMTSCEDIARYMIDCFEDDCNSPRRNAYQNQYQDIFDVNAEGMTDLCPDFIYDDEYNLGYDVAKILPFLETEIQSLRLRQAPLIKASVADDARHNIRSVNYSILHTTTTCWRCKEATKVFGILLPDGHDVLQPGYVDDIDDGIDPQFDPSINGRLVSEWASDRRLCIYYNLSNVADSVLEELAVVSSNNYSMDRYNNNAFDTLINHCQRCGVRQSENNLNQSFDSAVVGGYAFALITYQPQPTIFQKDINKPFAALGRDWVSYSGGILYGKLDG